MRRACAALAIALAATSAVPAEPGLRLAQSRESLFGEDAEARDEPASGVRWGGFYQGTAAYTYADPSHWSRAVNRLQVYVQGSFAEGVTWRASARVDVDPVYIWSDFYPADVRENQRLDFFIRETYLDFAAAGLDWRIGRQQIVWGEVVGLFFADVVSGRDQRDFILPTFDIIRIPQWAARAEWFRGDFHAEAIWIPVRSFDDIGKPGAEFYPPGLTVDDLTAAGVAVQFNDEQVPARTLANSSYGLRFSGTAAGWDLSAFWFRSYSAATTFYRDVIYGPAPAAVFTPSHDRIWQVGGTVSRDMGPFVLRAEAVYTSGQGYSVSTLDVPDGVVKRDTLDWIVSLDIPVEGIGRDTRVNMQGFERHFMGGDADIVPQVGGYGASLLVSTRITPTLEPSLLWIQGITVSNDRLLRPRLSWYFERDWVLAFGVDIFTGPDTGYFGRFGNRDRVYAELRYDF